MFRGQSQGFSRFLSGWGSGSNSRSKSARDITISPKFQTNLSLHPAVRHWTTRAPQVYTTCSKLHVGAAVVRGSFATTVPTTGE